MDTPKLNDTADQAVEEAERHRAGASPPRSRLVKSKIWFLDPSGQNRGGADSSGDMSRAGVLVGPHGERYYNERMVTSMLGVTVKELARLIHAAYLPPPEIRFRQKRVFPEYVVSRLQREARAGGNWAPYR
jgi:hypothetical protein